MYIPELKQFGELGAEDFQSNPVWIGCHTADYGKAWYEDTDEQTFRPYDGDLPADPHGGVLLVRAVVQLKDGTCYPGFVSPGLSLGAQQPQIFVNDRRFAFWGGRLGIPQRSQQELYAALGKPPDAIFPLRFVGDPGLTLGSVEGEIEGFYKKSHEGIQISFAVAENFEDTRSTGAQWLQMSARSIRGYPQPEDKFEYRKIVYAEPCMRCGIFEQQITRFRFRKTQGTPSSFMQLNWVRDAFFAPPKLADDILQSGITGLSLEPVVHEPSGKTREDLVQLLIPTIIGCVETSHLPVVTCRPDNEETVALRAQIAKRGPSTNNALSPQLREYFHKYRERMSAIPYCGRIKHHPPNSVALIRDHLASAPDVFQSAEWFGSGAAAFRLTIVSRRFANLVRERRWKGLEFRDVSLSGYSERETM